MLLARRPSSQSLRTSQFSFLAFCAASVLAVASSCSPAGPAGNGDGDGNGSGDGDGNGTPGDGDGGVIDPGDGDGIDPGDGDGDGDGDGGGCNELDLNFEQTIPNVVILVDQSGSMWGNKVGADSYWDLLKPALLNVIQQFDSEIAFQFRSYTAPAASGPKRSATCPSYVKSEKPALGAFQEIQGLYEGISALAESETPTIFAVEDAIETLKVLVGNKHIILVTDGQPDYCDSNHGPCAVAETIGVLQEAHALGIGTTVVGLVGNDPELKTNLQLFANAGAGVGLADPATDLNWCWSDIYQQPMAVHPPTYTAAGTDATVHIPASQDTATLQAAMEGILKGVKSCTFELGDELQIIASLANRGGVFLQRGDQEEALVFDSADGWALTGESEVTLQGKGCADLQAEEVTGIRFDFPCDIVVVK